MMIGFLRSIDNVIVHLKWIDVDETFRFFLKNIQSRCSLLSISLSRWLKVHYPLYLHKDGDCQLRSVLYGNEKQKRVSNTAYQTTTKTQGWSLFICVHFDIHKVLYIHILIPLLSLSLSQCPFLYLHQINIHAFSAVSLYIYTVSILFLFHAVYILLVVAGATQFHSIHIHVQFQSILRISDWIGLFVCFFADSETPGRIN